MARLDRAVGGSSSSSGEATCGEAVLDDARRWVGVVWCESRYAAVGAPVLSGLASGVCCALIDLDPLAEAGPGGAWASRARTLASTVPPWACDCMLPDLGLDERDAAARAAPRMAGCGPTAEVARGTRVEGGESARRLDAVGGGGGEGECGRGGGSSMQPRGVAAVLWSRDGGTR